MVSCFTSICASSLTCFVSHYVLFPVAVALTVTVPVPVTVTVAVAVAVAVAVPCCMCDVGNYFRNGFPAPIQCIVPDTINTAGIISLTLSFMT